MEEEHSHEFFTTSTSTSSLPPDQFVVDDLLVDFSNEDDDEDNDAIDKNTIDNNNNTNCNLAITLTDTSNSNSSSSSSAAADPLAVTSFPGDDLCVPCDDLAELEWLSNFVEDSFTTEDVEKLQLISGFKTRPGSTKPESINPNPNPSPIFTTDISVPAKARSKRPRAAAGNWASRGILLESPYENPFTGETILSSHHLSPPPLEPYIQPNYQNLIKKQKKKEETSAIDGVRGEERRCLHCATDKTPQWRTGPMGPKTLCNACGVRYKSGRLVPEYRPAASPTFVLTKHSNSHRKVMELRRQKEMTRAQHDFIHHHDPAASMIFDDADDYLIHHNVGPTFTNMV